MLAKRILASLPAWTAAIATCTLAVAAQDDAAALKNKPITTASGKVAELLKHWWQEGTAAGNVGDWYDNRDGGHSDLNTAPFPQLQRITYSEEDVKLRKHWAAQRVLLPKVVFGNSSTSAPPTQGGSNPRQYYVGEAGIKFLDEQYRSNNLYIYPEHRDHDPGHNGKGDGYGDLYPTNTPYLIISQGSSGSDQPFMRAIPLTLAAFRPEVKQKLTETKLLMPTLQWLMRSTNKHLKDSKEYVTGKAHPTVFEGSWVDELAMVQKAHALSLDKLPPLVQLKVTEEMTPQPVRDYFDPGLSEKLADTPGVIARVFRGKQRDRRLVVSAADSFDVNKRPLTFTWVVLRGDADKIRITPRNKEGSAAELVVSYQLRRPIAAGATLESNRIDIGVFAHNGVHHSPPAFITFYSLDNESRTYATDGRVLEIGYGHGEVNMTVTDWQKLLEILCDDESTAELAKGFTGAEQVILSERLQEYDTLAVPARKAAQDAKKHEENIQLRAKVVKTLEEQVKQQTDPAERDRLAAEKTKWEGELQELRKQSPELTKLQQQTAQTVNEFLERKAALRGLPLVALVDKQWRGLAQVTEFQLPTKPAAAVVAAMTRLIGMKLAKERDGTLIVPAPKNRARTAFEISEIERFVAALLTQTELAGIATAQFQTNFVDQRLAFPKDWRDVYRYDSNGRPLGWTRYDGVKTTEFSAQGLIVVEKDRLGRCTKGHPVRYQQEPIKGKGFNTNLLRFVPAETIVVIAYANDDDFEGTIAEKMN